MSYEVRRIYGPQIGMYGVYDTVTHTWVHLNGHMDMTESEARQYAEELAP